MVDYHNVHDALMALASESERREYLEHRPQRDAMNSEIDDLEHFRVS